MAGGAALQHLPPQDMIYCAGLLDYLPERQAQMLVAALFARLAPGGTLVIGNMKAGTDNVWPLTFVLDWELIYRNEAEMHALAALTQPAAADLALDPTGYNYLLSLTARG
jgi:extracellular factor (EF) 3-hydroxypalmitic acid methyl ester biosynthesis protein